MAGIQLSGLASGMDTDAVISQLMRFERIPRGRMELKQAAIQARSDGLGEIAAKLKSLATAATALRSAATWGDVQIVTSSDTARLGARATAGAAPGGHQVTVTSLASAEQRTFTFVSPVVNQPLVVNGQNVDLLAGATVADAVAAINAKPDLGVVAVEVAGKLVLSSRTTGAANGFTATGLSIVEDPLAYRAGKNAVFSVDGVGKTSASNVVTDAIPGVELTLKAPVTDATVSVGNPGPDLQVVKDKVKAFVEAYNGTLDIVRGKLAEKRVPTAATTTDAKRGALFGDTNLQSVLSSLRGSIGDLSALGITTGAAGAISADAVAGKLVLDETKLAEAVTANPYQVQELLGAKTGVDGLAQRLESVLTPQTQAGGILDERKSAATRQLTSLKEALARFDDRLAKREEGLRARFAALEQALSRSQAQQADLAARLGLR